MERKMTNFSFQTTAIDCRTQMTGSASSDSDLTPLEIQRWEDDGGAVLADPRPQKKQAFQGLAWRSTDAGAFADHLVNAERYPHGELATAG